MIVPLPILLVSLCAALLIAAAMKQVLAASRRREVDWQDIVARLQPVSREGIRLISEAYLHPQRNQIEHEPQAIFELVGGLAGINAMYENATVMLELAGYATRWNEVEGAVVTEMVRRDARRLQKAVTLLQWQMFYGRYFLDQPCKTVGLRLQEVTAVYALMSARTLALYRTSHAGLYPSLAQAL